MQKIIIVPPSDTETIVTIDVPDTEINVTQEAAAAKPPVTTTTTTTSSTTTTVIPITTTTTTTVIPVTTTTTTTAVAPYVRKNLVFDPGTNLTISSSDLTKWNVKASSNAQGITNANIGGKDCIKFYVKKGDPEVQSGVRAELTKYNENKTGGYPYEVWIGVSYYVPTDWVNDPTNLYDIVNQWHDDTWGTNDGAEYHSPFDFAVDNNQWRWQARYGTDQQGGIGFAGTVEKGKWTDFVFHIKFVKTGTGIVEIWKDGVKTVNYTGRIGYNHTYRPFFKLGNYKWPWNPRDNQVTNSTSHTIYAANIRIGNNLATYNDVAPTQ